MAQRALFWTAPLRPAGHLPLKGGDKLARPFQLISAYGWAVAEPMRFPPLAGEMAGRPEGVAKGYAHPTIHPTETATC